MDAATSHNPADMAKRRSERNMTVHQQLKLVFVTHADESAVARSGNAAIKI